MASDRRVSASRQSGGSLVGLLVVAILAFLIWKMAPLLLETSAPANRQTPSGLSLDGPTRIRAGGTATFFVSLRYPTPIDTGSVHRVTVEISTDSYGDNVLDSEVRVVIRDGSTTGRGSFALTCADSGGGRFVLRGSDGEQASEGAWQLFARVADQATSEPFESGASLNVICGS